MLQRLKFEVRKRRSQLRARRIAAGKAPILLQIGAGPIKGENGWTTLDLSKKADLCWNLLDRLPFPDGSVSKIYSSHVFEHFDYHELQALLAECRRVLRPGGDLLVCVPDARFYINAYLGERDLDGWKFFEPAFNFHSRLDYVNYVAYMGGQHKILFDQDNLLGILSDSGFDGAALRSFDPELDLEARQQDSVHAVAYKKAA